MKDLRDLKDLTIHDVQPIGLKAQRCRYAIAGAVLNHLVSESAAYLPSSLKAYLV